MSSNHKRRVSAGSAAAQPRWGPTVARTNLSSGRRLGEDGPMLVRLAVALFALQSGFHGFTASLPVALARAGVADEEIGVLVGLAAVVQVPAAFAGGALVDRFGGLLLLAVGAVAYLIGAGVMLLPGVDPAGDRLPFAVARVSQGIGIALTLPAALSLVARLVTPERRGFGLAFIGSAQNLTLVAMPPLSLAVLGQGSSLDSVALVVVGIVVFGVLVLVAVPIRLRPAGERGRAEGLPGSGTAPAASAPALASRWLGFAFRREWIPLLVITLLYVSHWGVVTAYLPQRAELAGADVGLFFVADGIAVLALRIPSGWLADRIQPRWLVLTGLLLTALAIGLLVLPPTTPVLIVAGALTGGGAGLVLTPLLVEISRRSTDADRGSGFAMMSAALAGALVLGSIGAAPIIASAGFEATILATIVGLACATLVALADPRLATSAASRRGTVA
jgi:MFS transporter, DHA1 family, multidrug resistance protein